MIVLDSGDLLFQRYTVSASEKELERSMQKAQLILKSIQQMGFDAVGVGDDDLTLGKEFLLELTKGSTVPFLSSNLLDEGTRQLLFRPYLLKKVNGLRIGIFSLLSPDAFLGKTDPRRKGLLFRPPREVAREMVKALKPNTDLIILLSHLGYPRDVELAQAVPGIHFILGAHTAMNLLHPPVIGNTVLLMSFSKGMYAGNIELTLNSHEPSFYDMSLRRSLESTLRSLKNRINGTEISQEEKARLLASQEDVERRLKHLRGENEFINTIIPLSEDVEEDPNIARLIGDYNSTLTDSNNPAFPK